MSLIAKQIPCLKDNYGLLLHDTDTGATAAIDAPDGMPLLSALAQMQWTLTDILITHRHWDHTQGIDALKTAFPAAHLYAPAKEASYFTTHPTTFVKEEDVIHIGASALQVIETPGHTIGHIVYWSESDNILCAGDTLFSIGCGRVNETPMHVMWESLYKLRSLPAETEIYCGHEYTQANGRFALTIDPDNLLLREHLDMVAALRAQELPSLPSTIALELAINPFLRADNLELRAALDMRAASDEDVFAYIRELKNKS